MADGPPGLYASGKQCLCAASFFLTRRALIAFTCCPRLASETTAKSTSYVPAIQSGSMIATRTQALLVSSLYSSRQVSKSEKCCWTTISAAIMPGTDLVRPVWQHRLFVECDIAVFGGVLIGD